METCFGAGGASLMHLPQEEASHTSRPLNGTSEGA